MSTCIEYKQVTSYSFSVGSDFSFYHYSNTTTSIAFSSSFSLQGTKLSFLLKRLLTGSKLINKSLLTGIVPFNNCLLRGDLREHSSIMSTVFLGGRSEPKCWHADTLKGRCGRVETKSKYCCKILQIINKLMHFFYYPWIQLQRP